ncbi:hypothetical protein V496_09415 [Pseudogymnoascus sp. VKM F-4515 (FW-2607)]|nr:hypothetical protein V496_09415 [Pseudogymnoascus sp. VKM F-4515 (FW-2607)]
MSLDLQGVALVTGAGGSIGQAIVQQFARDGVTKIAGVDISVSALDSVAASLASLFPAVEFQALTCDLADEAQVEAAFQKAVSRFSRLDYVVNNAGIGGPLVPTTESDVTVLERIMSVNLKGVWLCERAALKQMLRQEPLPLQESAPAGRAPARGSIINIGSVLSLLAVRQNALYTMSKHALTGLTKTDALDFAKKGIRVNTVCPGFVDTPLVTPAIREILKVSIDKTPMGRLASPQEIADGVVFLASDRASYITGISLAIDGGYIIH